MNLDEHTQIIKHREKSIQLSFWDIGKDLNYIKEKSIFVEKYQNFENYVVDNFSFTLRHAERMMAVATQYERQGVIDVGLTKLHLLLQVPEESRDEIIEEIQDKGLSAVEIKKRIERMKTQAGTPARTKEEIVPKLIRQFNSLDADYTGHTRLTEDLREGIVNWLATAEKHSSNEQISSLITKAIAIREDLK